MPPVIRADQLAHDQGLAESREKAKRLIMAGEIIFATTSNTPPRKVQKPGQMLQPDTALALLPGQTYVSRGAYKLLTAIDGFHLDVRELVCLDAGASTGGFTDCLLQHGASRVYALDVGKNQLHEKLRADPRVISMEGINLRHASQDLVPEKIDFLCGDVSFISLTLVLPNCLAWLKSGALAVLLIKPQFELSQAEVHKGVVRDEKSRQKAINKITTFCASLGMQELGVLPAAIKGPKGNQEYLALFRVG